MLQDYIRRHELDILLKQEITSTDIVNMRRYETLYNLGIQMQAIAIVARREPPYKPYKYHHSPDMARDSCGLYGHPVD
jgi:hypothetical protein